MLTPDSGSHEPSDLAYLKAEKRNGTQPIKRAGSGDGSARLEEQATVEIGLLPSILREDIEDAPFWKEVVAFANMPQSEIDSYSGRFVAVYHGDIVDSDTDEGELALRFYRTFGYVPVYIHRVGVEDAVIDIND